MRKKICNTTNNVNIRVGVRGESICAMMYQSAPSRSAFTIKVVLFLK